MCVWGGGGGGWDRGGGDRGCPSCSERTRSTTYICKFIQGGAGGTEAVQAAQRGQEIQPISVSLFSVCVGGGGLG